MTSHYRTLGVDPEADPVAIRSAYLALMRRFHPDGGGAEADPARAKAVTAAWDVLRDPERRAAYDETRQARFQPGGAIATGERVRGGAAGRNLFLLLAAGKIGLGWWALGQPQLMPVPRLADTGTRPAAAAFAEPDIRPAEDRAAMHRRIAPEEAAPAAPRAEREPEVERPVVVAPPLPVSPPPRLPTRSAGAEAQPRRPAASNVEVSAAAPAVARNEVRAAPAPADASPKVDLAPLERHLQILTDQSFRYGTEAKRARLSTTRETFLTRLRACETEVCKRDAYLRRNAEIGEIMRN
jgi:curved DNA-binding protein CbpA